MIYSKERPNHFLNVDVPIVSSYRREQNVQEVKTAALYFKNYGLSTYPDHLQNPISIDDEFVFFGDNQDTFGNNKRRLEIEFLKAINRAKLVYVVATNGYLGRNTSIELAYGLFINAPVILSQSISDYGEEVPQELKRVIENNEPLLPIVPIKRIKELKKDQMLASLPSKQKPPLSILRPEDKNSILLFYSLLSTTPRDHSIGFAVIGQLPSLISHST